MTEKTKNNQKSRRVYGCGILLVLSVLCISLGLYALREMFKGGFAMGPGTADYCMSTEGVNYDFKLSGQVVDQQSQPMHRAQVKIGSDKPASCIPDVISYSTTTNENGEFSFGPVLFGYGDEFFISVSIEGCLPSILYDDLPDDEPVTIVLNCDTTSTP